MAIKKTRLALLTALAVQQLSHSAFAQTASTQSETSEPAASQTAAEQLPEVEVSGEKARNDYATIRSSVGAKTPTAIQDIPQSITIVNRAVMDAQGAASLSDALRTVPGITIGGAEGGQIGNNINLRGFTARTDIFLDGMRDRGQYYRDTFFLESVEVLKGPSSMLFGRGSTGGVVNQVSKAPTLREQNEISATVGTHDYYRATADFNKPLSDTSAFRLNLAGQDVQSTRDVLNNEDYALAPSLRLGIGTPTEITLSALVAHNRDMPDYGFLAVNGRPLNVSRSKFYGLTDDRTIQDVATVSGRIEHKVSPNLTLRNQTQVSRYTTDVRETYPNAVGTLSGSTFTPLLAATGNATSLPLSDLYLRLASHDRKITDKSVYNQTDVIGKFETGGIKHTAIAGIEVGRDIYENQTTSRNNLPILSVVDPAYVSTPANSVTSNGNLAKSNATTVAVYGNDTLELNKHWKLVGGLRWDRFDAELSNTVSTATPPLYSAEQTVHFTSVRGGVIYQPTETQSYYASYGTSFNPSLEQLTVTAGQQNLDPEKNRSYEVGGKWDLLGGNLSLTSALFEINKTNARTQVDAGVYELDGEVRVRGFEVGLAGRITPRWQVFGGYTRLNAEIVEASARDATKGKVPANTPRNSASLWSTYNVTPEWEAGGGFTYLSERFANNTNLVSAGGFTRWDATIAYHQPKYDVRLNLLNLTDKEYFDSLVPSDGGRAVPGIGRTALLTVSYRF
ncbi:TonB-dependent receptor [Noviherbaspirillum massiliense]|uniref:TonB-dependent receptor n=1 Tax=Noviherbaspirillum massiliense TaxID=1465823 RepID=UPI0002E7DC94|nr:TonB-dependent siderophore receptor [Noviherbaspirillum massiliense]